MDNSVDQDTYSLYTKVFIEFCFFIFMGLVPLAIKILINGDPLEKKIHHTLNTIDALLHVDMLKMPDVMETYSALRKSLERDMQIYNQKRFYEEFSKRLKNIDNTERLFSGYDARND